MNRIFVLFGMVGLLLLAGCTDFQSGESGLGGFGGGEIAILPHPTEETRYTDSYQAAPALYKASAYEYADASADASAAQKTIQTKEATVSIKVKHGELETKLQQANAILEQKGADTLSILYDEYGQQKTYSITFRILPEQLDETLEALKGLGDTQSINVYTEDVTREYTDLNIRLTNKQLELQRLYELYNRSESVEDLLAITKEITSTTAEIEQLESEQQALQTRIAKSIITLQLYEPLPPSEANEGRLSINVNEGQLETKLQSLKDMISAQNGEIKSLSFTERSGDKLYSVIVSLDPSHMEEFIDAVRAIGEVSDIDTNTDPENRPEKSLVYYLCHVP